jgi:hypothetical protein
LGYSNTAVFSLRATLTHSSSIPTCWAFMLLLRQQCQMPSPHTQNWDCALCLSNCACMDSPGAGLILLHERTLSLVEILGKLSALW